MNGTVRARILVVDDEASIASTLAKIFENHGYDTATATSGEEAVQIAGTFQPNLILSDVVMTGMNGIEAGIQILEMLPGCKLLFMSGNAAYHNALDEATAEGFDFEVIPKPIYIRDLLAKVSAELDHHGN